MPVFEGDGIPKELESIVLSIPLHWTLQVNVRLWHSQFIEVSYTESYKRGGKIDFTSENSIKFSILSSFLFYSSFNGQAGIFETLLQRER